jgi:hypothetical protein
MELKFGIIVDVIYCSNKLQALENMVFRNTLKERSSVENLQHQTPYTGAFSTELVTSSSMRTMNFSEGPLVRDG